MEENKTFDFYKYVKIVVALLFLSLFAIGVCYGTLETAMADELKQQETTAPAESEPETIYSDGSYVLTSDGSIVDLNNLEELEDVTHESETDVSDSGTGESSDVLSETDPVDGEGSLSSGSVSSGTQNTEISDSTVVISDSTVYIQPVSDGDDETDVGTLGVSDTISLPADHCITYEVMFDGTAYTAVFPLSAADSLAVSDGVLCNVGSSSVTGRLFKNSFDTGTYGEYFCTLNSVLSTSGNNNAYRYGSWSYVTYYSPYQGTSQTILSGNNTYGNIYVVEKPAAFSDFDTFEVILLALVVLDIVITIIDTVRKERRY